MTEFPSKSAHIRALGAQGLPVSQIAATVGVRYQHARKVLVDAGLALVTRDRTSTPVQRLKPSLSPETLLQSGFVRVGCWRANSGGLTFDGELPVEPGVYAFCDEVRAFYVGVATVGLAKRLYSYRKPGLSQTTNIRVNALLMSQLDSCAMDVLVATPGVSEWNGLPVELSGGLELGLIRHYALPWNQRGL